jgi:hypothetical protein
MGSDLELVHLAFNRVKELSLNYGDSIPHLISVFNEPDPQVIRHLPRQPNSYK